MILFRQRLVVRLAVGMISVALLSLLLTFALQVVNLMRADLQPPDIEGIFERLEAQHPDDPNLATIREFPRKLRRALLATTLFSVVISAGLWIVLAIRFARGIAQPIERVTSASARITGGDLGVRVAVPEGATGEVARLSEHFNEMAGSLETFERERTEMIAAIAHELRTPLAVMQARLEVLEEGIAPLNLGEIKRLSQQTRLLTRLVDDLRTLSLADANRLSLHKRETNVTELVRRVSESFSARADKGGINLELKLEDVWATVDPERLEQILINLLDNALKYTPPGGGISVTLALAHDQICLGVSDTGPGFKGEPERLFKRFYTADNAPSGSGLGLALVQVLIEVHGGAVTAKNQPDRGAFFEVCLPTNGTKTDAHKPNTNEQIEPQVKKG